jgi:hypothetical protein
MPFNESQLTIIVNQLLHKTKANEVLWETSGNRYYMSLKPNTIFSISAEDIAPDVDKNVVYQTPPPNQTAYRIRIIANENDMLADFQAKLSTPLFNPARSLYFQVESVVSNELLNQYLEVLKQPGVIGHIAHRNPSQLTLEQQKKVIQKMRGNWALDYTTGNEVVRIDDEGRYYIGASETPKFTLTVIACNEMTTRAEVAKDQLDGKRHSIEMLTFAPNRIFGVAKEDQRKVIYTKLQQ